MLFMNDALPGEHFLNFVVLVTMTIKDIFYSILRTMKNLKHKKSFKNDVDIMLYPIGQSKTI